jgi:hypothetical protein
MLVKRLSTSRGEVKVVERELQSVNRHNRLLEGKVR